MSRRRGWRLTPRGRWVRDTIANLFVLSAAMFAIWWLALVLYSAMPLAK